MPHFRSRLKESVWEGSGNASAVSTHHSERKWGSSYGSQHSHSPQNLSLYSSTLGKAKEYGYNLPHTHCLPHTQPCLCAHTHTTPCHQTHAHTHTPHLATTHTHITIYDTDTHQTTHRHYTIHCKTYPLHHTHTHACTLCIYFLKH